MVAARQTGDCVELSLRVQPRASRNALLPAADGRLRVALTAPPVDGAANAALIDYISGFFEVPRRQVRLLRGEKGREKVIELTGIDLKSVNNRLARLRAEVEPDNIKSCQA